MRKIILLPFLFIPSAVLADLICRPTEFYANDTKVKYAECADDTGFTIFISSADYDITIEPNGSAKSSDLDIAMPLIVDFYIKVKDEYDAAIAAETQKKQAKEAKSGTATFVIPKALIDPKVKPK